MGELDTREWLLTNGLGSFACGTICDVHTRTYHGWLIAALDPPVHRTMLLSRVDVSLELPGQSFSLNTNVWESGAVEPQGFQLLQSFQIDPVPTWVWSGHGWQLTQQLIMPHQGLQQQESAGCPLTNSVLVQYHYHGRATGILRLRPLICDRDFHHQQRYSPELRFSQLIEPQRVLFQASRKDWLGTPWQLRWTAGSYQPHGNWYYNYRYPEETQRGLSDLEDLYSPGELTITLQPAETVTLEARVGLSSTALDSSPLDPSTFQKTVQVEQQRLDQHYIRLLQSPPASKQQDQLWRQLLHASDQFIAYRASISGPTVIAGYPWFNDWGRDTLIALPGLTLATQRYDLARGLLKTFGRYCQEGLIPNAFPDEGVRPFYNSIDAALWWIETLGIYVETTQDWDFLKQQYPLVRRIYKGLTAGTLYNIRVDALDGLVSWDAPGVALTWMDALVDGEPVTPRTGKPIEINALWYSALCWLLKWSKQLQHEPEFDAQKLTTEACRYAKQADQVKKSLRKFWNPASHYFFDTIEPNDFPDASIRPNAIIALSLSHCGFPQQQGQQVLTVACDRLLTPYGLRSLDPADPHYQGRYQGSLWQRDRAYHQGTVWMWLLGPFIRAWRRFYGNQPLPIDWQPLLHHLQHQACLGSISEIFDGDFPHNPQGAFAQAWSVAELLRHWDEVMRSPSMPD